MLERVRVRLPGWQVDVATNRSISDSKARRSTLRRCSAFLAVGQHSDRDFLAGVFPDGLAPSVGEAIEKHGPGITVRVVVADPRTRTVWTGSSD
jgi:hypothetical protein